MNMSINDEKRICFGNSERQMFLCLKRITGISIMIMRINTEIMCVCDDSCQLTPIFI